MRLTGNISASSMVEHLETYNTFSREATQVMGSLVLGEEKSHKWYWTSDLHTKSWDIKLLVLSFICCSTSTLLLNVGF